MLRLESRAKVTWIFAEDSALFLKLSCPLVAPKLLLHTFAKQVTACVFTVVIWVASELSPALPLFKRISRA